MSKSVNLFYMKSFSKTKFCRLCYDEITPSTSVVTYMYRTEGKDFEMATCSKCSCGFLDQEIERLESLKIASQG